LLTFIFWNIPSVWFTPFGSPFFSPNSSFYRPFIFQIT
jgi:hypothetical protein